MKRRILIALVLVLFASVAGASVAKWVRDSRPFAKGDRVVIQPPNQQWKPTVGTVIATSADGSFDVWWDGDWKATPYAERFTLEFKRVKE